LLCYAWIWTPKGSRRIVGRSYAATRLAFACAKLYDRKTPITAADLLNDRVVPLFEEHDVKLLRAGELRVRDISG
jgi:hypothetical protein